MKKIIYALSILILLLLFFDLFLLKRNKAIQIENQILAGRYDKLSQQVAESLLLQRENNIFQHRMEGMSCPDIELEHPKTRKKFKLSSLLKEKQTLFFFRFKETDCDACIQQALKVLKDFAKETSLQRITILSGYKNIRQFYAFAESQHTPLEIYNVMEVPIELEEQETPYFFILNGNLEVNNAFIFTKKNIVLTTDYLKCMIHKYWHCAHEGCEQTHF